MVVVVGGGRGGVKGCWRSSRARTPAADGGSGLTAAAAGSRWELSALRLSQQRPGGLRVLRTGEKRAYQRATKDYAPGGRLEGHARQGIQEERLNSNYCRQCPSDAALARKLKAGWEARAASQAKWRAAGPARR